MSLAFEGLPALFRRGHGMRSPEPVDGAEATPGRLSGYLAVAISLLPKRRAETVAHRLEPRASEGNLQASKAAKPQEALWPYKAPFSSARLLGIRQAWPRRQLTKASPKPNPS